MKHTKEQDELTAKNLEILARIIKGKPVFMGEYFSQNGRAIDGPELLKSGKISFKKCGNQSDPLGWAMRSSELPIKPEHFYRSGTWNPERYGAEYFPSLYSRANRRPNGYWPWVFGDKLAHDAPYACMYLAFQLANQHKMIEAD